MTRTKRPVPRRIRNNIIARKMAIKAGLVIPPGVDPMFPEGVGLGMNEYRTSMLRTYRRHRRTKLAMSRRQHHRQQAAPPQRQSWWRRAIRKILPTAARR